MNPDDQRELWLKQLEVPIADYEALKESDREYSLAQAGQRERHRPGESRMYTPNSSRHSSTVDWARIAAQAVAAIQRIAPGSIHDRQARGWLDRSDYGSSATAGSIIGVAQALRDDVRAGYLKGIGEIIHGELFSDFLEMAQHLLEEGFKDPAAVVAGSALEEHLRQMCNKAGIDTTTSGGTRPKKADLLNAELAKAEVYTTTDQKSVTSWLGLRNDAAHGHHKKYEASQVRFMIDAVRDFIRRHPA